MWSCSNKHTFEINRSCPRLRRIRIVDKKSRSISFRSGTNTEDDRRHDFGHNKDHQLIPSLADSRCRMAYGSLEDV
uniref:Uncharacterized protein n=1 Tax=Cucumis melo TaxID=3656 RepID=A0A9I9EHM8_CUCME